MISSQDNYTFSGQNKYFDFIISSALGDREEQQDVSGYFISEQGGAIAICDGMGGHRGGKLAATTGVQTIISACESNINTKNIRDIFISAMTAADENISTLCDTNGERLMAGTTAVSVYIHERQLQWASVGDSRIYLLRNNDFVQTTTDHNLKTLLKFQLQTGEIQKKEYEKKMIDGNMLINFLGMGGLLSVDANNTMLPLERKDTVFLTTDGLYKVVDEENIKEILMNFANPVDAAEALISKARRQSEKIRTSMDNTTFAIIKIK